MDAEAKIILETEQNFHEKKNRENYGEKNRFFTGKKITENRKKGILSHSWTEL